ncbi:CRAL-TRIO domain-containing protein [Blastocladiella britannica]|nr:CRAL-TRIO domain-containing protein [Blastocladiella britannica]
MSTTSTLTDDLRAALRALRTGLTPDYLAQHALQPEHLVIWKVNLANVHGSDYTLTPGQSVVLLKFLRAREFVVADALAMLTATLVWRRDFNVQSVLTESFPESMQAVGQVCGRTRTGEPITFNYYGALDVDAVLTDAAAVEKFVRWRVQLMERAMALLDFEQRPEVELVMQVHDYAGASMRPRGNMRDATRQIIALFSDHYPECLARKLFVNVPALMSGLFAAISIFSAAKTRAKFQMVGESATRATLWESADPLVLPARYGGLHAGAMDHDSPIAPPNPDLPFGTLRTVTVPARSAVTVWISGIKAVPTRIHYHVVTSTQDIDVTVGVADKISTPDLLSKGMPVTIVNDKHDPAAAAGSWPVEAKGRGEIVVGNLEVPASGSAGAGACPYLVLDNSYSYFTSKDVRFALYESTDQ